MSNPQRKKSSRHAQHGFNRAAYPEPDKIVNEYSGQTLLMEAVLNKDLLKVEQLLASGAYPDKTDKDGKSALHHAVRTGQEEIAHLLLKQGASINLRDKTLATPLFEALESPQPFEMLTFLMRNGADADITDSSNMVPLHVAARKSAPNIIDLLSKTTRNPARPDSGGMTPLHYACQSNSLSAIKCLVEDGAPLLCANNTGDTPLHLATARLSGESDIVSYLLTTDGARLVNAVNMDGRTPLHQALSYNKQDLARKMLEAGADPNMPDGRGLTPLRIAAQQWNANGDIVLLLIHHGADVNRKTQKAESTALHQALEVNNMTVIRILLEHDADVNAKDQLEYTPLMLAVTRSMSSAVELLLQAGADMDMRNKSGQTALHLACIYSKPFEAGLLLNNKADPNAKDQNGQTPLHLAVNRNYTSYELGSKLLAAGGDPLLKDKEGASPYDLAYERNEYSLVTLFRKKVEERGQTYTPRDRPPPPPSSPWRDDYYNPW